MNEQLSKPINAKKVCVREKMAVIANGRLKPKQIGAQMNCAPWGVTTPDNRAGAPFSVA